MATHTDEQDMLRIREKMTSFPCMFNMPYYEHVSRSRLINREQVLRLRLEDNNESVKEKMKVGNRLTWIYYKLSRYEEAEEQNESVLRMTKNESIVALGNHVFLMELLNKNHDWSHFKDLESQREQANFNVKKAGAKAEQAALLAQLEGVNNLKTAIQLYEECLEIKEVDAWWMYELGQCYRRLDLKLKGQTFTEKAKDCLQKTSGSSDKKLKALSLAKLAEWNADSDKEAKRIGMEKAVAIDPHNDEVLLIAGLTLMKIPSCLELAITYLEESVAMRPSRSALHHYLGRAYTLQLKSIGRENTNMKPSLKERAIHTLRKAYETSGKKSVLLEIASLSQGMGKSQRANSEAHTYLTSRPANRVNYTSIKKAHIIVFCTPNDIEILWHLSIALLVLIAFVKNTTTADEYCTVIWSHILERGQIHDVPENTSFCVKKLCKDLTRFGKKIYLERVIRDSTELVNDDTIDVTKYITSKTDTILRSGQDNNEEALLYLELVLLRPELNTSGLRQLHMELLEKQARQCLQEYLCTSAIFFHQLFKLFFNDVQVEETNLYEITKVDMVMLFNDSHSNTTTSSICTNTANGLEDVISTLFGLVMVSNPLTNARPQDDGQGNSLTNFVRKHNPSLILIVFDGDGADNDYIWDQIKSLDGVCKMPPVVIIQCHDEPATHMPRHMTRFPGLSLGREGDAFPNKFCLKDAHDQSNTSVDVAGVVKAYFGDNNENVMKLFKHLIQKND